MTCKRGGGSYSRQINNSTTYNNGSDLAVTTVDFNTMANMGQWVTAFFSIQGGISPTPTSFSQAFLTLGNIQNNPFFLTIGDTYLPFGIFNGDGPYANNLDTNAFRAANTNQVAFNYAEGNFYTNFALLHNQASRDGLDDFSYTLSYTTTGNFNYSLGAGYLYDIRGTDSEVGDAYPNNDNKENTHRAVNPGNTISGSRNAAYDVNALVAYGFYSLNGEFNITQTGAQNLDGSAINQMSAWNLAAAYAPTIWGIPTTFSLGYSATHNMNSIPLPLNGMANNPQQTETTDNNASMAHQWLAYMSNEFVPNVYMSPEFAYDTLYNGTHTWSLTYDITANI